MKQFISALFITTIFIFSAGCQKCPEYPATRYLRDSDAAASGNRVLQPTPPAWSCVQEPAQPVYLPVKVRYRKVPECETSSVICRQPVQESPCFQGTP